VVGFFAVQIQVLWNGDEHGGLIVRVSLIGTGRLGKCCGLPRDRSQRPSEIYRTVLTALYCESR
jgi:hypothetical protein